MPGVWAAQILRKLAGLKRSMWEQNQGKSRNQGAPRSQHDVSSRHCNHSPQPQGLKVTHI